MVLRIGEIDYANCTPIFSALRKQFDCSDYRFVKGFPSQLNRMLSDGDIDLCPSSSIAYAQFPEEILLLPELSISSIGPVRSVMLFSLLPLEKLAGENIAVTSESETSAALLKVIFGKYLGYRNRFVAIETAELSAVFDTCPAVMVIGDTALRWSGARRGIYRYDLGELWHVLTGLPFVFALWMIRKKAVMDMPEESARVCARLQEAKRMAASALGMLISGCPELEWIDRESLLEYWRIISYDLTTQHLEGVKTFFRGARQIGILEKEPEICFLFDAKRGGINPPLV